MRGHVWCWGGSAISEQVTTRNTCNTSWRKKFSISVVTRISREKCTEVKAALDRSLPGLECVYRQECVCTIFFGYFLKV